MEDRIVGTDRIYLKEMGYEINGFIGEGIFGEVFKGVCNENATKTYEITAEETHLHSPKQIWRKGHKYLLERSLQTRLCAIKRLDGKSCLIEAGVLMGISHPNIVEIYNAVKTERNNSYIIMEFINGNELNHVIQSYMATNTRFTDSEVKTILIELIEGLRYLHSNRVVHGDIHTGNIMLHFEDPLVRDRRRIKYIDFGLARVLSNLDSVELLNDKPIPSDDIQRLGIVFSAILDVCDRNAIHDPVYSDLDTIVDKMWCRLYHKLDDLWHELYSVLDRLPPV